ncbi:manganese-dependent inorganic pyrophosphatase [Barrientosiimonas marina]|uniref:Probable manganese-dependent inorganic pyrophosphatase n=1 Tax=Lentibacillus kimchii TaxID=1542911 RepID=A0ABW2URB9_9BACI
MRKTLIFGHKSPDTDTICSALVYADLKSVLGVEAQPARLGDVNQETQYALDYFGAEAPERIEEVGGDVSDVILVDHNESQQSADNLQDFRISEVIDHHRVANFETKEPLYMRVEPVGCTATILNDMYKEKGVVVSPKNAGLLLSAIMSDSLLLKSPTCTEADREAAYELAGIAGVDVETYGLDMLKAGADLSDKSAYDLTTMDAKEFTMGDAKVQIAQVNAVDTNQIYESQAAIEKEIDQLIKDNGLDLFLFVATDILENDSDVLVLGTATDRAEQAFDVSLDDNNRAFLKGVVSRKKQVVIPLTEAFTK